MQRSVRKNSSAQKIVDFQKWISVMERIQKNLETYLEEKRAYFPRFYFISNEELLQILANAARLLVIEKHLNKCFENVNVFLLGDEDAVEGEGQPAPRDTFTDIFGVESNEGERLEFTKIMKVRQQGVEVWLKSFEDQILSAVSRNIRDAHSTYYGDEKDQQDRTDWVM